MRLARERTGHEIVTQAEAGVTHTERLEEIFPEHIGEAPPVAGDAQAHRRQDRMPEEQRVVDALARLRLERQPARELHQRLDVHQDFGRHRRRSGEHAAGVREQVIEVDLLLAELAELRDDFGDRRVQLEQAALDQREREHVRKLLGDRHGRKDCVWLELRAGGAVRVPFAQVEHDAAVPGDAQRDAVAAAVLDVGQNCCAHAREAFGIEAETSQLRGRWRNVLAANDLQMLIHWDTLSDLFKPVSSAG